MCDTTGADIVIQALQRAGVRVVAGMPGGANLPLYDALGRAGSAMHHVLVRHEQAAGFIAQGVARATGQVGVCFATSGPGATNLLTALADAQRDSVPLLAITGQVPTGLLGTDAFQEVDTVALASSITKRARLVRDPTELDAAVCDALALARSGRPGPVLLDIPKDVQAARVSRADAPIHVAPPAPAPQPDSTHIDQVCSLLAAAQRPILYVGGGIRGGQGAEDLRRLADTQGIPVAATLMGLGLLPHDHPLWLGMLGMHAAPYTNLAMRRTDLLLAIGVRFDDRATGRLAEFCPDARVVHVDIDSRELGKLRRPDVALRADAAATLATLAERVPAAGRWAWRAEVDGLREAHPLPRGGGGDARSACGLIEQLSAQLTPEMIVTTDVGQHQMWAAQRLALLRPRQLLTSGGLGTMGFGLPAAIGASLATGRETVCITGDGSLMLSLPELATLADQALPVKLLVLDNGQLGMVRQQQHLFYGQRYQAAHYGTRVDFVAAARAMGLPALRLPEGGARGGALSLALRQPGPMLIHAEVSGVDEVLPVVPGGAANHEMIGA